MIVYALLFIGGTRQLNDSPAASVQQTVGMTDVTISYHRPAVKERQVWGALVPYDKVWRAGANEATTIQFSTPVMVGGKAVPAGTYGLFVQPSKDKWTVILSKDAQQWGAFGYDSKQDVARVDVTPVVAPAQEWLSYEVVPQDKGAGVTLAWEKLRGTFAVEIDTDALYHAYLKTEVSQADASKNDDARYDTYLVAAKFYVSRGEALDVAGTMLDKAEKVRASFWVDDLRARLLQKQGKTKEAIASLDKARGKAAEKKMPQEYLLGLDALKKEWQTKR